MLILYYIYIIIIYDSVIRSVMILPKYITITRYTLLLYCKLDFDMLICYVMHNILGCCMLHFVYKAL